MVIYPNGFPRQYGNAESNRMSELDLAQNATKLTVSLNMRTASIGPLWIGLMKPLGSYALSRQNSSISKHGVRLVESRSLPDRDQT